MTVEWSQRADSELNSLLEQHGLQADRDYCVQWDEKSNQHPRNWAISKKAYNVALLCFFEFWMTAISSAGTAASDPGREEYHISRTLGYFMFTSLYLLGQAVGSIFCSPISETFGRRPLYIVSIAVYCVFCLIIAAIKSDIAVCFGRFISGAASAIPATVAFGSFEDMHEFDTRIWIVYGYTVAGNCGLVLGPIYSAYVSTYAGWRWVFYISAIVSGVGVLASLFLKESRTAYLLELKVAKIRKETGNTSLRTTGKQKFKFKEFMRDSVFRPLQFLITEPIVLCCSALMAISYSLIYGLTEGLTVVYTEFGFNESTTSSLSFIPLLLGLFINVLPRIYDHKKLNRYKRSHKKSTPDSKVSSLVTSCPALAVGFWLFAWTIPPMVTNVPWVVSMIGLVLVGYCTNDFSYILFGYLTDSYGSYAASACAALSLSRTIMAAIFPLFTYTMYKGLGGNISTSIFASIATVFCVTPVLFIKYGPMLRKLSPYAQTDEEELDQEFKGSEQSSPEPDSHKERYDKSSPTDSVMRTDPASTPVASEGSLSAQDGQDRLNHPFRKHKIELD